MYAHICIHIHIHIHMHIHTHACMYEIFFVCVCVHGQQNHTRSAHDDIPQDGTSVVLVLQISMQASHPCDVNVQDAVVTMIYQSCFREVSSSASTTGLAYPKG